MSRVQQSSDREASRSRRAVGDPIGRFYCWRRGVLLPPLPPLPGLVCEPASAEQLVTAFPDLDMARATPRAAQGCQGYAAFLGGLPVAFGWSAAGTASIGELGLQMVIPPGERYLWDFVTLPAFRGRGVYPRLLQAILALESEASCFWIGHDFSNRSSERGITRAGFLEVGWVFHLRGGGIGLMPTALSSRAPAAAALLGVPLLDPARGQ